MSASRWTAEEVKAALRRRHPATQAMGIRTVPGPWTCIEELLGCDLVAFSAHQHPQKGASRASQYPRVGYEVKVSRSDYRVELRNPEKRARAVGFTNEFYIAVPLGLLSVDEKAAREPLDKRGALWVPSDVGLVEVTRGGCRVVVESPVRKQTETIDDGLIGVLARHVSSHPDPRHDGVVAADRELSRTIREQHREARRRRDEAHARNIGRLAALSAPAPVETREGGG